MVNKTFEDSKINTKLKLSALWVSVMFCYIYCDYFELYVPEKVDGLITGANRLNNPIKLLIASIVLAIPALMISLTILLKSSLSRIINITFGMIYSLMMLFIAINSLNPWYEFYVFLAIIESTLTLLIVFYAWKWPRRNEIMATTYK